MKKKMLRRKKQSNLPTKPVEYPVGSFVESEAGYFYITSSSKRYRFITKRVLDSWNPPRLIKTTESALASYRVGYKMKFRSGSLIHNIGDGKIYLIENNLRRHVVSPDALERIGATKDDVVLVSLEEILLHEEGE
jgi:hypothetical protein